MEPRSGGNGRGTVRENYLHGTAVTSMIPPIHKQGYIGGLENKSMIELQELLERQQKLLENRKFIDRLPDKGEKIRKFTNAIQNVLSKKDELSRAENESKSEEKQNNQSPDIKMDASEDVKNEIDENMKIIERGFMELSVHEGHFYKVVKNAEERQNTKSKFAISRAREKVGDKEKARKPPEKKHADLTSASVRDPVHGSATVLSVHECCSLYSAQQKKIQEIQAHQVSERISRRVQVFEHPEGSLPPKEVDHTIEKDLIDYESVPAEDYLDQVD